MGKDTTTKFKVDISELKAQFQEAQRTIKTANAEFKQATAGLDNWSKSSDGVTEKLTSLNKVVDAEKQKLQSLEKQYELTAKNQGETSKGAQDLYVKLLNQKATVAKVEKQIRNYTDKLESLKKQEDESKTATSKLTDTISNQEDELKGLKKKYSDVILEQGKSSDSAKDLKNKISNLSGELKDNKSKLKDAEDAADKFDRTLDKSTDNDGGITTFKIALGNLASDAIQGVVSGLQDMITELGNVDSAYNSFQGQTGASAAEMDKYKEKMKELYSENYGENMQDISDAMATVVKNSKETDPDKIKELTKNALVLRDTFGYDVQESMRAVNMLMDQFGISGTEAFNLVVQGAQKGLDKNGDMLDSINEYSVHYKQMGYDADGFLNSLANGTDAGTFSVDKLGDAMKEFGIRSKDTADSTTEGFELIGLKADKMRDRFAQGGDEAYGATQEVLTALFNMDDKVKQNQAGVALFGTMWEDLGADGVKALMNTEGELSKTKESMKELNEIKYDDAVSNLERIGREFKTEVLLPIVEKSLPKLEAGIDFVSEHLDELIPVGKGVATTIAGIFVVSKITKFVSALATLKTALVALNLSNPLGWLTLGVGLIAAFGKETELTAGSASEASPKIQNLTNKIKDNAEETEKIVQEYRDWKTARDEAIDNTADEFEYYENLWTELKGIVDKNGEIKKGYEDRAKFITGELSEATGIEIENTGKEIKKYQELMDTMDDVLLKKEAKAILDANETAYREAIEGKDGALSKYVTAKQTLDEALAQKQALQDEYVHLDMVWEANERKKEKSTNKNEIEELTEKNVQIARRMRDIIEVDEAAIDKAIKAATENYENCQTAYLGYINTIENHEGLSSAIISGDAKKIEDAMLDVQYGFIDAKNGTNQSMGEMRDNVKTKFEEVKTAIDEGMPGVTQEMLDEVSYMWDKVKEETDKFFTDLTADWDYRLLNPIREYNDFLSNLNNPNYKSSYSPQSIIYQYNQTVNSPTPLDRLGIARNTNNLLKTKG